MIKELLRKLFMTLFSRANHFSVLTNDLGSKDFINDIPRHLELIKKLIRKELLVELNIPEEKLPAALNASLLVYVKLKIEYYELLNCMNFNKQQWRPLTWYQRVKDANEIRLTDRTKLKRKLTVKLLAETKESSLTKKELYVIGKVTDKSLIFKNDFGIISKSEVVLMEEKLRFMGDELRKRADSINKLLAEIKKALQNIEVVLELAPSHSSPKKISIG